MLIPGDWHTCVCDSNFVETSSISLWYDASSFDEYADYDYPEGVRCKPLCKTTWV